MTAEEIVVPNCKGCSNPIDEGAVVAFGDSLFHIKWYKKISLVPVDINFLLNSFICDKCKECVKNKTNLLLLDNGKPVCDNCSYNCTVCNGIIRNEAIMTGE